MATDDSPQRDREAKKRSLMALRARLTGATSSASNLGTDHPRSHDTGEIHRPFPLTDLQAAHFVAKQVPEADPVGCHMYLEFTVAGLDADQLERAWGRLLEIHPMLRARIERDGTQCIPRDMPPFSFTRYEAVRGEALEQHIEAVRSEMAHKIYRPHDWPLFDIRITSSPRTDSRVHVSMDSWIVDAASADTIYRQWRLLYEAPDTALPTPGATFRDFVLSTKAFEGSEAYQRCVEYWADKLRNLPEPVRLPYRRTKSDRKQANSQRRRLHWACARNDWKRAQDVLRAAGLSPSAALLGIFVEQLRSLGGHDRFPLIVTLYNRPRLHPQIDEAVGPFSSTSIFVADHHAGLSFAQNLHRYQRQLWRDLDHGGMSGIAALRNFAGDRPAKPISIVFNSALRIEATQQTTSWLDNVDYAVSQTPGIDLQFHVYERVDGLHLSWDFVYDRFEPSVIEALFERTCLCVANLVGGGLVQGEQLLIERVLAERRRDDIKTTQSNLVTGIPMTPLQQAYLAQRLIDPNGPPAAVYREFELAAFDHARLQGALNATIEGSDLLRSLVRADRAQFIPFTNAFYPIVTDDARGLDRGEIEARLQMVRAQMERALCADQMWPPLAVRVTLMEGGRATLQVLLDSIVFDGYGAWQFYQELCQRYAEDDRIAARPQLCYGDYARARERYRESGGFLIDQIYWSRKFESLPAGPRWPWPVREQVNTSQRYSIDFNRWRTLKDAAAARGVPPAAVLLSLYAEVLQRWCRCGSFAIVSIDYPQRSLFPDLSKIYGDFSSLSWIASEDHASPTLEVRAQKVADMLASDRIHDWGNPLDILRQIGGYGEPRASFPAAFTNCIDAPAHHASGVIELCASASTPGIDIDVMATQTECGLGLFWQVHIGRIPDVVASAMVDDYRRMLDELALSDAAWQTPLKALGLGSKQPPRSGNKRSPERTAILEWNRTDADYDREQRIHRLFERQAASNPEHIALVADDGVLTYGALERRANQMARFLQKNAVAPGQRVGVLLDHSFDMVVSLLAILKAGATYVPLSLVDPHYRISSIIERAKASAILSTSAHAELLSTQQCVILLDKNRATIEAEDGELPPEINTNSDDTAYVIFTSGTTSEPKGVMVAHRPVINLIEWGGKTFGFNETDRVLFVNSLSFDLSVFDIFGLLAYGGSIRIVPQEHRTDPTRLAHLLLHGGITFWNSAPAYLQFLMPSLRGHLGDRHDCKLRLAFLSGDRVDPGLIKNLRDTMPEASIVALGGATEATVWSNYFLITKVDPVWTSVPYGRPIQNARYYILNEKLEPCRVGVPGRLYIGGECLSSGYFDAPELTRTRFLADPFHDKLGMTMFDSGDLARFMDDGNIEFIGRADDQIKIRGFRIGLGEIEAALARCGIGSPVALVRDGPAGDRLIAAFGTSGPNDGAVTDTVFWQNLREQLPDYMIPASLHILPSLPMTRNGKIDRRQLANGSLMAVGEPVTASSNEPPFDPAMSPPHSLATGTLAQFLCSALSDILSLPSGTIEPDSHFSRFGMTSLQFAVLSAKLAEASGTAIGPAKLFRCTSVEEIVETVSKAFPEALTAFADRQPSVTSTHSNDAAALLTLQPTPARLQEFAIIGVHGVMPQAEGLDQFWSNLVDRRDCVELIPEDRWDWRAYYGDPQHERDVTTANKAGFIRDVDMFDAAFFGISPREAELLDPRQRLLLEGTWRTLENAGYRASDLTKQPVGVFIGATGDEYSALLQRVNRPADQFSLTGGGRSFLANRLSYHYGWRGPSEVIDTTCSSSLVAVHNAIRSIQSGDCSIAIAGGINVMIDPQPHLSLAKIGVLSPDGACKTFDANANGYVRGEGVGLILIKPLAQAETDGDHIHAVISGTAINHGGRANSLTAPNSRAQADVIVGAFRDGAIEPWQIGYIEAHGTGTRLGDPIEVEGIKEAFTALYADRSTRLADAKPISIGTVKTSIGHLEAAAGIAGVLKVVLMLHRKKVPPLVHLDTLNPEIDVRDTPFVFQATASEWSSPIDDQGCPLPRAAGVSAFGIGGVNAHVLIREHTPRRKDDSAAEGSIVVPLSARSKQQLTQYAGALRNALRSGVAGASLGDVAFTMAAGREAFNERAAVVTTSLGELVRQLDDVAHGKAQPQIWYGNTREATRLQSSPTTAPSASAMASPDLLASSWVSGRAVDWSKIYRTTDARRVPLPGVPFAQTSHWVAELRTGGAKRSFPRLTELSKGAEHGYLVSFTGNEPFVNDHRINGMRILSAAAYLAFAGIASERLYGSTAIRIKEMTWMRTLSMGEDAPVRLRLAMTPRGNSRAVSFDCETGGSRIEYASATIEALGSQQSAPKVDVDAVTQRCTIACSGEQSYKKLAEYGIDYGPSLRVIRTIKYTSTEALARIVMPDNADDPDLFIHPGIVDGALQTVMLHHGLTEHRGRSFVPFSMREVAVYGRLPRECYVHAVQTRADIGPKALREYDITLVGPNGTPFLRIKKFMGLPADPAITEASRNSLRLLRERWYSVGGPRSDDGLDPAHTWHVTVGHPSLAEALHRTGQRVLANALLPSPASVQPSFGSAVPWDQLIAHAIGTPRATIVLWYDHAGVSSLPLQEQLRFTFDSIFDLVKRLAATRSLRRCSVVVNLIATPDVEIASSLEALSGLAKVAQHESPHINIKVVQCIATSNDMAPMYDRLLHAVARAANSEPACVEHRIDLQSGAQEIRGLAAEDEIVSPQGLPISAGGVYLITGGLGSIGRHIARTLLSRSAKVALIGRSSAGERTTALGEIGRNPDMRYYQTDVSDRAGLDRALTAIRAELGAIRGIFHCAGEARPGLLRFKSLETARNTLLAKVFGTVNLDESTRGDLIDFLVLFSSLASVTGPVGAADYAYASRYLDSFAMRRNALAARGLRSGRAVSVSWPVWADGGLRLPSKDLDYLRSKGLDLIDSTRATEALAKCMTNGGGHYICAYGNPTKFKAFLSAAYPPMDRLAPPSQISLSR
jgi:amino acid adenylation domain-containing protein